MLLYIMLHRMLANIILFAALFNAVCLHNTLFFAIDFFKCFVLGYRHIVCLFQILFWIMHSAFNLLVFLILCSHRFFNERAMCSLE